ncbi:putative ribonuclease H protein [Vitis vinifera]|uniref:Putative ribonuclease H protein n=1 Tax=Vitis vinifera TaxID=29760 RepID=A0A438K4Y4_VITVI|nr:putative ribonuclease H protein [Vitis vinifera]
MANVHSRRNWLSRLKVDDCWHMEELDLKNSVVGAFNNLYTEEGGWRPGVEGLPFMRLDSCEAKGLEFPFTEGEVFAALSDLGKDKAPARMASPWPSGCSIGIYPKEGGVEDLKDFRPISLVGSLYKLLAKTDFGCSVDCKRGCGLKIERQCGRVLCKLDIEKAYDRVSRSFLLAVLKEMGFGERWIKWIDWCIFTVKFSVMMRRAISGGYLSGWKVSGGRSEGMHISHLLFADDMLVFCEESSDEMTYLSWLLMWFEACLGLRINLEKSEMIPVGRVLNIEGLALELGCKVGGIPSSYLGMPLGAAFNSLAVWDGVEERFRRRLAMWKRQYISKGGRLTLIRSTMSSMPIYLMSLFHLPRKVRLRLEKIQRDFLWGGGTLAHKPHLVRWNLVCLEKRKGGLGVRNLSLMNNALLCKWNWRFANERNALWRSVISLKYGVEERGWCTQDVMGRNEVGLWKAIRKKWGLFDGKVAFHLGNGQRVKFWKDKWCGDGPLCESFPSLFSMSMSKNAWVSEVWNPVSDGIGWTPLFARAFNDWEIDLVERLLQKIQAFRVQREEEDRVIWTASNDGAFSVRSLYSMMEPGAFLCSLVKEFGGQECLPRRNSGSSPTALCQDAGPMEPPFLSFWNILDSLVYSEDNPSWVEWRVCGKRRKKAWQMAPLCIFWSVWKERNRGSLAESHSSLVSFVDWIGS